MVPPDLGLVGFSPWKGGESFSISSDPATGISRGEGTLFDSMGRDLRMYGTWSVMQYLHHADII